MLEKSWVQVSARRCPVLVEMFGGFPLPLQAVSRTALRIKPRLLCSTSLGAVPPVCHTRRVIQFLQVHVAWHRFPPAVAFPGFIARTAVSSISSAYCLHQTLPVRFALATSCNARLYCRPVSRALLTSGIEQCLKLVWPLAAMVFLWLSVTTLYSRGA
jgi:hypothetical protein